MPFYSGPRIVGVNGNGRALQETVNEQASRQFTQPLRRVLAFLNYSIHDVVNSPAVKRKVLRYYKASRQIARHLDRRRAERPLNLGLHQ